MGQILQLSDITKNIQSNRFTRNQIDYDMDRSLLILDAIGKGYKPDFSVKKCLPQYKKMVQYVFADPDFPGNLLNGNLLIGPKGTGKTLMFIVFQHFLFYHKLSQINSYNINDLGYEMQRTKVICSEYENKDTGGTAVINRYTSSKIKCFDDLGEDMMQGQLAMSWGKKENVIETILNKRYEIYQRIGIPTHATSNYPFVDNNNGKRYYKEFYGERTEDRMKEMFNIFVFSGESMRQK